jgi:hypothetical protein
MHVEELKKQQEKKNIAKIAIADLKAQTSENVNK